MPPHKTTCRWKGCRRVTVVGHPLCTVHLQVPPSPELPKWIRELPFAIGTGIASSVLYDLIKTFAEHAMFHDTTAEKVDEIQKLLRDPSTHFRGINEVAQFIDMFKRDPSWQKQMAQALAKITDESFPVQGVGELGNAPDPEGQGA